MEKLAPQRLVPLDWMRGLVMVLMTLDHASAMFNGKRVHEDSFGEGAAGASLFLEPGNPIDFLTRWFTHLCAPTFVFLAGTALALSVHKRLARGDSAWAIDRHLLARGVLLILLEVWMSLGAGFPVLQVLYAIGGAFVCMTLLRRLPSWALVGLALAWMVGGEWATEALGLKPEVVPGRPPVVEGWAGFLFTNGLVFTPVVIPEFLTIPKTGVYYALYPLVPWLAVMMLGWAFGRWIVARRGSESFRNDVSRFLGWCGVAALGVFLLQRLVDGYGNFWLPRGDDTFWRWLQVSKYPPSLAFYALELGLMALILAAFFRFGRPGPKGSGSGEPRRFGPLCVFGQVALFFYLIHLHLMGLVRLPFWGMGEQPPFGVEAAWIGAAVALVLLYPVCVGYRALKAARPKSFLRFF